MFSSYSTANYPNTSSQCLFNNIHNTFLSFPTVPIFCDDSYQFYSTHPIQQDLFCPTLSPTCQFFNVNDSNVDWSLHSPPQRQSPSMNTAYPFYDSSMNTLTSTTSLPIIRCLPTSSPLTIYQRTSSSSKSIRLQYTSSQRHTLTEIFNRTPYPNSAQNDIIAKRIGVKREQIRIWFQNHRRLVSKGIKQSKKSEKMALNYLPSSSEQQKLDEILIEIENEKSC